jgi:MraZ protein
MNGFICTETHSIDQKGRIAIPAAMRRQATRSSAGTARPAPEAPGPSPAGTGEGGGDSQPAQGPTFVIVMGFEGCLALYTESGWNRIRERLEQLPLGGRKARAFSRALYMDAKEVTVDGQGRITLPPALVARAGLDREAVLLGQGEKLEIWNPDRLRAFLEENSSQFESLAEEVLG